MEATPVSEYNFNNVAVGFRTPYENIKMLQASGSLKSTVKFKRSCTESLVFQLHYKLTPLALLFCFILTFTHEFASPKIQCASRDSGVISIPFLNNYCWAASTYSVSSAYLKEVGVHVPHAGVVGSENKSEYEYRNYYQYVPIVLFVQAVLFYVPHMIWKSTGQRYLDELHDAIADTKLTESKGNTKDSALDTFASLIEESWGGHTSLVFKYLMCEILAATNVLVQSYLLDVLFHGRFLSMGLLIKAYYSDEIFTDPLRLFPLVTICNFQRYGASGAMDAIDALCVLPLNAYNGKIFLAIWLWFAVLLFLSVGHIIHTLLLMLTPAYKMLLLKLDYLSVGRRRNESFRVLAQYANFGDWFVLSSIRKNVGELKFCRLTETMLSRLSLLETEVKET